MSLFRRNEIWYASYSLPGGKRIKESLGTKDKRQAQELHDKRKAELWRVEKLGDLPDVTFEEACLRWLEEKADKKSLDSDKSRIEFWLEHFEGIRLKDISEAKIYSAVSRMHNRKTKEIWKQKVQAAIRKGKELPVYEPKPVSTQTKAKHLAMIKAILRAAERDWKWLEKAPVIKIPAVRNKRVRWLEKEEAKRLIDECPEPLKSVVKFALATGLRKSNIINAGGCPASNAIHGHINDFLVRTGLRSGVSELQLPCFTAVRAEIALMSGSAFAVTHHPVSS